ncbi:hypothetical protein B0H10DRAFT_2057599 [Mycena sp. CBHHK59/15]|nr:hypothetical protein B0H10DRAFT_2057599 [Mycena sp. CBHHK59/15]
MDPATRTRVDRMVAAHHTEEGRPLSELMKTKDTLKGAESQRLRTYCTSQCMEPGRDLDEYGVILAKGDLGRVKADWERRVARHSAAATKSPAGPSSHTAGPLDTEAAAAQEIYALRWGPTQVTIYNLLGLMRMIYPIRSSQQLEVARFLIYTAKVPVDAPDLSGTQALSHAFSTKPSVDFEYAQLLYDGGGDVNSRNRYGGTVAHEIMQIWTPQDKTVVAKATAALKWFLDHGGNIDAAEGDGLTVRYMLSRVGPLARELKKFADGVDRERKERAKSANGCCGFCGREEEALPKCGRCKETRYCSPSVRACQKLDWPHHKKGCVKVNVMDGGFSFLGTTFKPA